MYEVGGSHSRREGSVRGRAGAHYLIRMDGVNSRRCRHQRRPLGASRQDWADDVVVRMSSSPGLRKLQPDDEHGLEDKVIGQIVQQRPQHEALQEVERPEDDPVAQPLDIIIVSWALEGLEGQIRWNGPSDEVRDGVGEWVDEKEDRAKDNSSDHTPRLWNIGPLLQMSEDGVFAELLVELGNIVLRLVLGVNHSGVVTKVLSTLAGGRHR